MIRNYFADLELGPEATLQQIRAAYKRLVKRFHPDAHAGDSYAEESFKVIQEAYTHLNSDSKITKLRTRLSRVEFKETTQSKKWKGNSISSIIIPRKKPRENLDLYLTLAIQGRVIERGGKERFQFVFERPCPRCKGRGGAKKAIASTCKKCAGIGVFEISRGAMRWSKTCDICFGKGFEVHTPCGDCLGKGKVADRQAVEIMIPVGIDIREQVVLKGLGNMSIDGSRRGDLFLTLLKKA